MVEEFMQVPYRKYRDFKKSKIVLPNGTTLSSKSIEYLMKKGNQNDFQKMEKQFSEHKVLYSTKIGNAKVNNIRIRDIFDITKSYLEKDINFLLSPAGNKWIRTNNESIDCGGI